MLNVKDHDSTIRRRLSGRAAGRTEAMLLRRMGPKIPLHRDCMESCENITFDMIACKKKLYVCRSDAAAQKHAEAAEEEDRETPNYEEKAQEIVQSILQEVVNTVAGGTIFCLFV